jgi:hypothetical protein
MQEASNGYCGDFPTPTTYFTGTAFSGPNSSARSPTPSTTPGQTGPGAYSNPNLYAQPPTKKPTTTQGPTTTVQSGGGGVAPPGSGGGTHGGGHGNGGGHGKHG